MCLLRVAVNAEQLLYRSPGGVGRYTAQLLTLLPEAFPGDEVVPFVARHGRESVTAALTAAGAGETTANSAVVLGLPRPVLYEGWLRLGRPRLPDLDGADVVHAPSVAVPPRARAPLVVTVHDAAVDLYPEAFPSRGRRFHRLGLAAAAARADAVITVSEAAAAEIVDHSDIPRERIRVVHNGVSPVSIPGEEREAVLSALGLAGRPYVLWVGSFEPRKGIGTLVAAMADLRRRGAAGDAQLVLAGYEGWLGDGIVDATDRAALGESLHQVGRVGERDLWALYAGATVFAFPSLHEGFGLPVIEAMSQGVPVIASDIAAMREVAAGPARLLPPTNVKEWASALEDLLSNESERRRMAGEGIAHSRRFSARSMIEGTRAVYEEVAGGAPR